MFERAALVSSPLLRRAATAHSEALAAIKQRLGNAHAGLGAAVGFQQPDIATTGARR